MSIYRDKSREEAFGIIDVFITHHEERTGVPADPLKLMEELRALKTQKVKANFDSIFSDLSPLSIQNCIDALKDYLPKEAPQPEPSKEKAKPSIMPSTKR